MAPRRGGFGWLDEPREEACGPRSAWGSRASRLRSHRFHRPLGPQAWCGNTIHWGTRCAPGSAAPPRVSVGFNFLRGGERLQSGAPSLSRADARALGLPQRLAIIARSLLAYSPWYELDDGTVPADFFAPH